MKPLPESVAAEIVTGEVPVEVKITDCVEDEPRFTFPKAILVVLTLKLGTPVPVPLRLIATDGVFEELLLMVNVPVAVLAAVGANFTYAVAVWPGDRVTGSVALLEAVKPAPVTPSDVIVTGNVPVDVTITDWVEDEPKLTFPKASAVALTLKLDVPVPLPLRLTTFLGFALLSLLEMVICPVAAPALVGAKATLSVADCPGFKVMGKLIPDALKPEPATAAELIVNGRFPEDVSLRDAVAALLMVTFPNERLVVDGLKMRVAGSKFNTKVFKIPLALAVRVTD